MRQTWELVNQWFSGAGGHDHQGILTTFQKTLWLHDSPRLNTSDDNPLLWKKNIFNRYPSKFRPNHLFSSIKTVKMAARPSPGGCHGWLPPGRRGSPRVRRSASTSGPGRGHRRKTFTWNFCLNFKTFTLFFDTDFQRGSFSFFFSFSFSFFVTFVKQEILSNVLFQRFWVVLRFLFKESFSKLKKFMSSLSHDLLQHHGMFSCSFSTAWKTDCGMAMAPMEKTQKSRNSDFLCGICSCSVAFCNVTFKCCQFWQQRHSLWVSCTIRMYLIICDHLHTRALKYAFGIM